MRPLNDRFNKSLVSLAIAVLYIENQIVDVFIEWPVCVHRREFENRADLRLTWRATIAPVIEENSCVHTSLDCTHLCVQCTVHNDGREETKGWKEWKGIKHWRSEQRGGWKRGLWPVEAQWINSPQKNIYTHSIYTYASIVVVFCSSIYYDLFVFFYWRTWLKISWPLQSTEYRQWFPSVSTYRNTTEWFLPSDNGSRIRVVSAYCVTLILYSTHWMYIDSKASPLHSSLWIESRHFFYSFWIDNKRVWIGPGNNRNRE